MSWDQIEVKWAEMVSRVQAKVPDSHAAPTLATAKPTDPVKPTVPTAGAIA